MHELCRHASSGMDTYKKTPNFSVDHYCVVLAQLQMSSTKMTENMFAVLHVFILCIEVAFSLASCGKTSMFLKIYMSHPEDCSLYYVCFHGRRFLKKCDDDEVFDRNSKSCVPKGSKTDSCKLS